MEKKNETRGRRIENNRLRRRRRRRRENNRLRRRRRRKRRENNKIVEKGINKEKIEEGNVM